jgi:hypothetical protein
MSLRRLKIFLWVVNQFGLVRMRGLEPPLLSKPDPKSGASANFATSAW